jgi:4-hydroxy-tetrahydrodipicolinate synthase
MMPNLASAQGLYVVAQTPFDEQGAVDMASIDSLAAFYFGHGANGLTVLGVAGEAAKLAPDEAVSVAERYIACAGNRPVIVGVSNPSLAQLKDLTARVMDRGAAGVMIAPPHGLKTEEDLLGYFANVYAQIGEVPTVLQDFPTSTQVWMSVPSILRLIETYPQIQVIKEEDLPSLGKISRLRASKGRRVAILTGNNGVYLPQEMSRGIDGPMAGFSYPEMLAGVYRLWRNGEEEAAHDLFDTYLPLLNYENQSQWGVAVRKEVMRRRGALRCAAMRTPGPKLTAQDMQEIDRLVRRIEARVAARR